MKIDARHDFVTGRPNGPKLYATTGEDSRSTIRGFIAGDALDPTRNCAATERFVERGLPRIELDAESGSRNLALERTELRGRAAGVG